MYDFDSVINQKNTVDEKHDQIKDYFAREDLLPMWVAEMDFQTAPVIIDALQKRVAHGIFGYTYRSDEYQDAILNWYKNRHHRNISKDMISYDTGVLKSIFEMLRIFTKPHDEILVPVPAYPQFEKVITLANRKMKRFLLCEQHHRYEFDFDALDKALASCKVMLLCSPHNPGGRIWTRNELQKIHELCIHHHVLIICDEIHCDLTMNHKQFISMLEIDPDCIILNSVSKPFNLAGLQHSYRICQNKKMRELIAQHDTQYKIKSMNTLSMVAQETAYTKASDWLYECCDYIEGNYQYICSFLEKNRIDIPVFELEAGYLVWLDFSPYFSTAELLEDFLVQTCHIATSFGRHFDERCGTYTRLNIGTPRSNCIEAMERIKKGLQEKGKLL